MRNHLLFGWTHFWRQINKVVHNPILLVLTLVGNGMLLGCAIIFYLVEAGTNPSVGSFGDALWWAFATITTVGYGDVVPATQAGRVVAVLLMLTGGVLFLSFIALLSSAFIELEFLDLKRQIRELEGRVERQIEAPGHGLPKP